MEEQLLDGLGAGAGLVLRNLRLTEELEDRYRELTARGLALAAARRRVVQPAATRNGALLERDIHDGAQQRLVALAINLRVARARLDPVPRCQVTPALLEGIDQIDAAASAAAVNLLDVVSGRSPLIAGAGLGAVGAELSGEPGQYLRGECGGNVRQDERDGLRVLLAEVGHDLARVGVLHEAERQIDHGLRDPVEDLRGAALADRRDEHLPGAVHTAARRRRSGQDECGELGDHGGGDLRWH